MLMDIVGNSSSGLRVECNTCYTRTIPKSTISAMFGTKDALQELFTRRKLDICAICGLISSSDTYRMNVSSSPIFEDLAISRIPVYFTVFNFVLLKCLHTKSIKNKSPN
jgi:hypothetical protein